MAWFFAVSIWFIVMVLTPLLLQRPVISAHLVVTLVVATQLVVVLLPLWSEWGAIRFVVVVATVAVVSWGSEAIGVATGYPFGDYRYSDRLPLHLQGVPLLIPLAWMMMLIPSWGVAYAILGGEAGAAVSGPSHHFRAAALAGVAMVAWDCYVDPQMVEMGIWEWRTPSGYFGTPLSNFAGWWLVAFLLTILVRPSKVPTRPLLVVYSVTWILEFIGLGFFWGQPKPALLGLAAMGTLVLLAWKKVLEAPSPA